jgi:hypothetical protein
VARYISYETSDNSTILIEMESDPLAVGKTGVSQDLVTHAAASLEESLGVIRKCAEVLFEQIEAIPRDITDVEITFGVKVAGEIGHFIVAKASAEANFAVTLKWKLAAPPTATQPISSPSERTS